VVLNDDAFTYLERQAEALNAMGHVVPPADRERTLALVLKAFWAVGRKIAMLPAPPRPAPSDPARALKLVAGSRVPPPTDPPPVDAWIEREMAFLDACTKLTRHQPR
jgi:hypothetical protein